MKLGASYLERFEGWFVAPIEKFKELPEGDGGFLALSAALFLCKRYYRTLTNTHEGIGGNKAFKISAAKDLGLDPKHFKLFWIVYRNGIQHQGMPKIHIDSQRIRYTWGTRDDFDAIPQIHQVDAQNHEIRLDSWKFAGLIINKFRANLTILENAILHAFGEVT